MDIETLEYAAPKTRSGRMAWFIFLLAVANLMWATQGPALKKLEPYHLSDMTVAFVPYYMMTVALLPLLYWKRKSNPNAISFTRYDWVRFFVAGIIGQALAQFVIAWGVTESTSSNFSILNLLIPVITAVLAPLMLRERITRLQILCLAIGLIGVMVMSQRDLKNSEFNNANFLRGNFLIFLGCAGSAFYNVYCKGLMEKHGEIEILICTYIGASLASLAILLWLEPQFVDSLRRLGTKGWLLFILYSFLVYGISMVMFFYVLRHLPVTVASASVYLVPVFGVLLSITVVHEELNIFQVVGGIVVLASTILIMKYDTSL